MLWLIAKYAITAFMVVLISEAAKRSDRLGGLLAALPLVTLLVLIWMKLEGQTQENQRSCLVHFLVCGADTADVRSFSLPLSANRLLADATDILRNHCHPLCSLGAVFKALWYSAYVVKVTLTRHLNSPCEMAKQSASHAGQRHCETAPETDTDDAAYDWCSAGSGGYSP